MITCVKWRLGHLCRWFKVHGEGVSPKGCEFEPLSARTVYTCGSVAGQSRVRGSVRYITHDSYAISVVPPFNNIIYIKKQHNSFNAVKKKTEVNFALMKI